jgi:hypothetical protein
MPDDETKRAQKQAEAVAKLLSRVPVPAPAQQSQTQWVECVQNKLDPRGLY